VSAPTSLAEYRARVNRTTVTREDFRAFISQPDIRRMYSAMVAEKVPEDWVEDVTQDALEEALKAFEKAPPSRNEVLVVWIATIVRRVVADFTAKRVRRSRWEGPMPDQEASSSLDPGGADDADDGGDQPPPPLPEASYDPREDTTFDGKSVFGWLERQVADVPRDRETFDIILEHGSRKKTYEQLASEHGMTLTALSSRIFEFKQKYVPRYKRERDRNRTVLLVLFFVGLVIAIVLWLMSEPTVDDSGVEHPARPILDQIFPGPLISAPPPSYWVEPDAGRTDPP
jgi:DNA-directed RNA polymerase specialized sigma24 family protein